MPRIPVTVADTPTGEPSESISRPDQIASCRKSEAQTRCYGALAVGGLVLLRATGDFWPSAMVAMLFAVHPLHVESVAWVTERKDVLSGLFFVLSLGAYLHYVCKPSIGRYLAVLLQFALGLMAKPMVVT